MRRAMREGSSARRTRRMGATCAALVLVLLAVLHAGPASAESALSLGAAAIDYDEEGTFPHAEIRFTRGTPLPIALDVGLSTLLVLNVLDLDVGVPLRIGDRALLIPRVGPAWVVSPFGGTLGLGLGARLAVFGRADRGVAVDFMYRTFSSDDTDSAYPLIGGSVAYVWRRGAAR